MDVRTFLYKHKGSKMEFMRDETVDMMEKYLRDSVIDDAFMLMTINDAKHIVRLREQDFTFDYIAEIGLKDLGYNINSSEDEGKMLYLCAKRILRRSKGDWMRINNII